MKRRKEKEKYKEKENDHEERMQDRTTRCVQSTDAFIRKDMFIKCLMLAIHTMKTDIEI